MSSRVLSTEVWNENQAALPEGYIFSSLHQDVDHLGIWKASAIAPPKPPCECCGLGNRDYEFVVGSGNSPDSALIALTQLLDHRR